jgi:tryptophan-rich sensory protein
MKKRKVNLKILIFCIVAVYAAAFLGSLFSSSNVNTSWYQSVKPSITPPNWIFPVVWNILFLLIALSLYFAWMNSKKKKEKIKISLFFALNLILNVFWSFLFFSMKNPVYSFFELILLWLSIISLIAVTWKISRKSAYLLIPYLLWVSFAGVLNFLIAF